MREVELEFWVNHYSRAILTKTLSYNDLEVSLVTARRVVLLHKIRKHLGITTPIITAKNIWVDRFEYKKLKPRNLLKSP